MAMPKATRSSKLIDVVRNLRQGVHRSDVEAQVILENLGLSASVLGEDRTAEDVLEELVSGDKTLKKLINAASSYIRTQKKLDQLTKVNEHQAARLGRGALSSGQAWGASGWRLTPTGFSWQRPPNVRATESFTPTPSTHIAKYDTVPLTEGYSDQTTVVPYDPRFASQQNAREALNKISRQQRANKLWTAIRNLRNNFRFGGRKYKAWTDWQVEVFDFAKSHGFATGADGLRDAEAILKQKAKDRGAKNLSRMRSLRNYQRHLLRMTPHERERHELIMQYGGGPEGIALADEALRRRRDERVKLDQMTDYQRERHELVERYGGGAEGESLADAEMNRRADRRHRLAESRASIRRKAERIDLAKRYPAFKRFFLDSRNSTKDIHAMAGYLKGMSKIPVVGEILTGNPIVAGSLAAYGALLSGMGKSDAANKSVIAWSNARNIYGSGSLAFQRAAYMAGVEDPGAISRRLGKQAIRYGGSDNAESIYREFGSMMSGMTRDEKMYFAESIGFDDTDVAIAEMLAGGMKPSLARKVGANKAMLEAQKMAGFASGAGAGATAESLWLSIPGMVSAQARDLEGWASTDKGRKAAIDSYISTMSAAIGDDAYSENTSQSGTLTPSVSGGTSVSVHGNIIIENADNAQDVAEGIKNYVDKHTSRLRAATSQDPGAQ